MSAVMLRRCARLHLVLEKVEIRHGIAQVIENTCLLQIYLFEQYIRRQTWSEHLKQLVVAAGAVIDIQG